MEYERFGCSHDRGSLDRTETVIRRGLSPSNPKGGHSGWRKQINEKSHTKLLRKGPDQNEIRQSSAGLVRLRAIRRRSNPLTLSWITSSGTLKNVN